MADDAGVAVVWSVVEQTGVRVTYESMAPKSEAAIGVALMPESVDSSDKNSRRQGMGTLSQLPCSQLIIAEFLPLSRMPADGGGVKEDLRAL